MMGVGDEQHNQRQDWERVDARILGQIVAAQNFLFVLPDEERIAEFFAEALHGVPGVTSCSVCLGDLPAPVGEAGEICRECVTLRKKGESLLVMPPNFSCGLATRQDLRVITLSTTEHVFGFFILRTDSSEVFEPYWPFLNNLANYVALSLENRLQKRLLEKANEELEDRVKKRTEELVTMNVLTAQLEAANKELEAFAYSISHDLRAPLRHIDGFLELLQKSLPAPLDQRSQHYMDSISDAAKRMGALIDDLLAFSRVGRNEMSKRPVKLGSLVQEIVQEFAPDMQGRSIDWRIADLPTVTGDRAMLRLALTNLIANALKFTRGRVPAEIEIGWMPGQGAEITVFIRDNGVGFDMDNADKLFGVFQRLHRADEFEGTGIGLANVRRIINRHGGRTWAEGKINQGATLYFSLPQSSQET
jgi:signal transduction histidine kinase